MGKIHSCEPCGVCGASDGDMRAIATRCVWCGEFVCRECHQKDRHQHLPHEMTEYAFGFCPSCNAVTELTSDADGDNWLYSCKCGFGWAPRAIERLDRPGWVICPFCALCQFDTKPLPYPCQRCGMLLE